MPFFFCWRELSCSGAYIATYTLQQLNSLQHKNGTSVESNLIKTKKKSSSHKTHTKKNCSNHYARLLQRLRKCNLGDSVFKWDCHSKIRCARCLCILYLMWKHIIYHINTVYIIYAFAFYGIWYKNEIKNNGWWWKIMMMRNDSVMTSDEI